MTSPSWENFTPADCGDELQTCGPSAEACADVVMPSARATDAPTVSAALVILFMDPPGVPWMWYPPTTLLHRAKVPDVLRIPVAVVYRAVHHALVGRAGHGVDHLAAAGVDADVRVNAAPLLAEEDQVSLGLLRRRDVDCLCSPHLVRRLPGPRLARVAVGVPHEPRAVVRARAGRAPLVRLRELRLRVVVRLRAHARRDGRVRRGHRPSEDDDDRERSGSGDGACVHASALQGSRFPSNATKLPYPSPWARKRRTAPEGAVHVPEPTPGPEPPPSLSGGRRREGRRTSPRCRARRGPCCRGSSRRCT